MKKFSKIVLASGIVLGFSVTPELFNATEAQAQESIEPYYNYDGYTAVSYTHLTLPTTPYV